MPCRQNNTECTTTDRITNRAQVRGHTEAIEQEAAILRQQVAELQTQLRENSIEPRISAFPLQQSWTGSQQAASGQTSSQAASTLSQRNGSFSPPNGVKSEPQGQDANIFAQGQYGASTESSKLVGMSSSAADSIISPATGLSLSVFGMQVDLATFVSEETEVKLSSASWDNLFKSISKGYKDAPKRPPALAALPPTCDECMHYGKVYLQLINAFLPILDKADFLALVSLVRIV